MKKKLLIILTVLLFICGCESKKVEDIIPQGEYDLYELVRPNGTKKTRDEFDEDKDAYVDSMVIHIWSNNKGTFGKKSKNKYDITITDDYFVFDEDNETKLKYKYYDNKIEVYYDSDGNTEIYVKDYKKQLDEKYEEMIGKYELEHYKNPDGTIGYITNEIKENYNIVISNNQKAELNYYAINDKGLGKKYYLFLKFTDKYLYDDENNHIKYQYNKDEIILYYETGAVATLRKVKDK